MTQQQQQAEHFATDATDRDATDRDATSSTPATATTATTSATEVIAESSNEGVPITHSSTATTTATWTDTSSRERIAGSPLVPDCVKWADDGRVAVVSDANIMISTFMSRELEMYLQQSPAISKSFIFLPDTTENERVPIEIPLFHEPIDAGIPTGSTTYFLLNEADRHQYNPKELSLSKNEGKAFVSATWGPRGSGPNSSCALLALTSSSRISLHFSSSFHLSWKEVAVFSETLYDFFEKNAFTLPKKNSSNGSSAKHKTSPTTSSASKKRKRTSTGSAAAVPLTSKTSAIADYAHRCGLLATLTTAWSPFVRTSDHGTTSLIAFSGRKVTTVWGYSPYRHVDAAESEKATSYLSSSALAWIDTEKYGWVSTSTWQQMHYAPSKPVDRLTLAVGTTSGNVLLAAVPLVHSPYDSPVEIAIDRTILAPHSQPVFNLCLGSRNTYGNSLRNGLVIASGSTISVWNVAKKHSQPLRWKAHDGNITGLDINYFGDTIFTTGVDGSIKVWDKLTGKEIPFSNAGNSSTDTSASESSTKYPLFGLAVSPNSAQIVCVHIIPPAARPNRKSQADVSYSRVSSALEYLPSPYAKDPATFVQAMCRVLEESQIASTFTDVLWLCHEDNSLITSLHGSSDMTIPNLLNKLKGVSDTTKDEISRQPLYLNLCDALEEKFAELTGNNNSTMPRQLSTIPYLQASYLLRSSIPPSENHTAIRDVALTKLRRTLYGFWAERCLKELLGMHSQVDNFVGISYSERISALMMADFLSVQVPLSEAWEALVTIVYTRLGSEENIARWMVHLQAKSEVTTNGTCDASNLNSNSNAENGAADITALPGTVQTAPVPPPRQTCFICEQPVPFSEFDLYCASGHVQERCFLSFRAISSMDTWKCMGCGASACEIDFSTGCSPFYLLEDQDKAMKDAAEATADAKIECRLCGNFCSFFKY
ncbi:Zinc finger, c2h2, partial [Globisporangium splendens]